MNEIEEYCLQYFVLYNKTFTFLGVVLITELIPVTQPKTRTVKLSSAVQTGILYHGTNTTTIQIS